MPSYLDFDSTKRFRDFIISKTINYPDGPQTFNSDNYRVSGLSSYANIDLPPVDNNRENDLLLHKKTNIYKPSEYFIQEELETLPVKSNLALYPYFNPKQHSLIGIIKNDDFNSESELMKFAAHNIKNEPNGPIRARISQNLNRAINGKIRLLDALNGNTSTAINIATGREPIIDYDYTITTAKTGIGKVIDFTQTVAGIEFPWSEIPGDYLTNPLHTYDYKTTASTEVGKFLQDATGALGSMVGIQRRETETRKPSDLMIEYLGMGQRMQLYRLLSYSKYAPNYTTTARSQNASKVFNFIDNLTQSAKNLLGTEAPEGISYIGDDRGNNVKFAMGDFNDIVVRSPYYLSYMFDETATRLFEIDKNFSDNGNLSGNLTWSSKNSKNKIGNENKNWNNESSYFNNSLSTKFTFRDDSILGYTQKILDSMPSNGGESKSHIASVIDQTSRVFQDGDKFISKGSAVQYVNKFGVKSGVEYYRTWTKDRPYAHNFDLMKKGGNIRKFDGSVISTPYNLNIAPISNGKTDFDGSTNMQKKSSYYAGQPSVKKYMFSIENLVWKNSNTFGKTVMDLPYSERGPNGGRIMWFPPYDLSISEQNSANWETNKFIGRPEPIYTYQGAERNGSLSFKIVVDHPSILNLLVREEFKNMSDEEADNYINAFFAGDVDVEFYSLIQKYPMLDKNDLTAVLKYLNKTDINNEVSTQIDPMTKNVPVTTVSGQIVTKRSTDGFLAFPNNYPQTPNDDYKSIYDSFMNNETFENKMKADYKTLIGKILMDTNFHTKEERDHDIKKMFGNQIENSLIADVIDKTPSQIESVFNDAQMRFNYLTNVLDEIKNGLKENTVGEIYVNIASKASKYGKDDINQKISSYRSWSIINYILNQIKSDGTTVSTTKNESTNIEFSLKDLGYENNDKKIIFEIKNLGEGKARYEFKIDELYINSPYAFFDRESEFKIDYSVISETTVENDSKDFVKNSRITPKSNEVVEPTPSLTLMKRIIMKTLQESFYFKKLEETDPVVFKSLKEKLKYFHPAFHSTTPEGLNNRLTFLHQCIRPGDTLPIKGVDNSTVARNTTFGSPPICILRIGDFYHSKVVIKDLNITFDENLWDLNPEGIGMQPMIAKVTMQISFIGGHGLEKPISRLQNALSSNFYANTEMYDDKSESSGANITGYEEEKFRKEFLESVRDKFVEPQSVDSSTKNELLQNKTIGEKGENNTLEYLLVLKDFEKTIGDYQTAYQEVYNDITTKNGKKLASLIFSTKYRNISQYDVIDGTINFFGIYGKGITLPQLTTKVYDESSTLISSMANPSSILELDNIIPEKNLKPFNTSLVSFLKNRIKSVTDDLVSNAKIKKLEKITISTINSLDKLNFLLKYGCDVTINKSEVKEVILNENISDGDLYDKYIENVMNIDTNFTELNSDVDNTFDIINNKLTIDDVKSILKNILSSQEMIDKIKNLYSGSDEISVKENISKKLTKFTEKPSDKIFKLTPPTTSTTDINYTVVNEIVSTNNTLIEEAKKLYSSNIRVTEKLNYYKK